MMPSLPPYRSNRTKDIIPPILRRREKQALPSSRLIVSRLAFLLFFAPLAQCPVLGSKLRRIPRTQPSKRRSSSQQPYNTVANTPTIGIPSWIFPLAWGFSLNNTQRGGNSSVLVES
ncbi:hypothetical protein V8C44DRAFT_315080 [Trichoderma aethiopicum]